MPERFLGGRRLPPGLRRAWPVVLLAAALALGSYAQYAIGRPFPGWMSFLDRLNEELTHIYNRPQSVALAFILFVAAAVLFLLAVRARREPEATESDGPPILRLRALAGGRARRAAIALSVVGGGLWAYLILELAFGNYEEWYPALLLATFPALAALFLAWDRARGVDFALSIRWWEVALLIGLVGTFIGLNVRDLDSWRYSYIGDEYAFLETAKFIDQGVTFNLFSQAGAYGYHPLASSAYQAMVMKVFGFDYFGWKLASVIIIAATVPTFYFLVRAVVGLRPAVFATAFLAASHYLFAYAHTGYNNVFAVFPLVLAFALFVAGMRRSSSLLLFGSGLAAGMGFYTFFSARAAIVILALFVLTLGFRRWRWGLIVPLSLGFIAAVAPMFAVDRWDVVDAMLGQAANEAADPILEQIAENVPRALFAFNYSPSQGHYVSGALMDAASAVLAVLGFSYALTRIRSTAYRFLLVWFVVSLAVSGLLTPHDDVALTRLHITLPAMAAFAGVGVHRILVVLEGATAGVNLKPYATAATFGILVPLIFALNVQRFWDDSAEHSPTEELTVVVRAVMEGPCEARPDNIIVSDAWTPFITDILMTYGLRESMPTIVTYDEVSSQLLGDTPCAVLAQSDLPEAKTLAEDLARDYPNRRVDVLTDLSGLSKVYVFK